MPCDVNSVIVINSLAQADRGHEGGKIIFLLLGELLHHSGQRLVLRHQLLVLGLEVRLLLQLALHPGDLLHHQHPLHLHQHKGVNLREVSMSGAHLTQLLLLRPLQLAPRHGQVELVGVESQAQPLVLSLGLLPQLGTGRMIERTVYLDNALHLLVVHLRLLAADLRWRGLRGRGWRLLGAGAGLGLGRLAGADHGPGGGPLQVVLAHTVTRPGH